MARAPLKISDTILHEIIPPSPSKSQRRKIQIAEAAIQTYVEEGVEDASFEHIAAICKVSRPLIQHYFKDKDELFYFVAHYIRANSQDFVVKALLEHKNPVDQLGAYVAASFDWAEQFPAHAKVWILFFYYCSIREKYRQAHSELSFMAQDRISHIIQNGIREKKFRCADPAHAAKMIQSLIAGSLLMLSTEKGGQTAKVLRDTKKYASTIAGLI